MEKEKIKNYFTKGEVLLWSGSVSVIIISFLIFDRENYLNVIASLIGVTSLIFCAKGNPIAQVLMIVFSVLYGVISYTFSYYGEMLTYLGMTMPMSIFALVSWLKNPYKGNKAEVKVNSIGKKEVIIMSAAAAVVTAGFYFILDALGTANIIPSTISVTTSFVAVYLTFRRSPYFTVAYALNDVILIVLWVMATVENVRYLSVVVCFAAFLVNDTYCFICWKKIKKRQMTEIE